MELTMLGSVLSLVLGAFLSSGSVEVTTIDRSTIQGEMVAAGPERIRVRGADGERDLACEEIVLLRWTGRSLEKKVPAAVVELWNGDVLRGGVEDGEGEKLRVRVGSAQVWEIRIDWLRRLLVPKQAGTDDPSAFVASDGKDRIYQRREGGALDFSNGAFEGFQGKEILFRSSRSLARFPLDEIVCLVLTPLEVPAPSRELRAVLEFSDGSRARGKIAGLAAGKIEWVGESAGKSQVDAKDLLAIRFENGRYVYLSDLEPARVQEELPYGGSDSIRFPYRKDRSVGGRPLRVGGFEYAKGLGVHSRSLLVYRLGRSYRTFRASVGVDDEALDLSARGSVVFRVLRDGKLAYESPVVRGGAGALALPDVDVSGVEELSLEVDYADDFHVADRADWLEPVLIR